jgi:hypothetical protein
MLAEQRARLAMISIFPFGEHSTWIPRLPAHRVCAVDRISDFI